MKTIYYRDEYRNVSPSEILAITIGSIVEGCDGDGPSVTISRAAGTLTKANFDKALEIINRETDVAEEQCEDYPNATEYHYPYDYLEFDAQRLSDDEVNQEVVKIFNYADTYEPYHEHELSLWQLGRDLYKYTDCGPWTSFEVKD